MAKHPYSFRVIAILSNLTCFDLIFLCCARRQAQCGALNDNIPSDCRAFEPFSRKFHRNYARKYANLRNIQYEDLPGRSASFSPARKRRARGKYEEKKICTCMVVKRTRDRNGALSSIIVLIYDFTSALGGVCANFRQFRLCFLCYRYRCGRCSVLKKKKKTKKRKGKG